MAASDVMESEVSDLGLLIENLSAIAFKYIIYKIQYLHYILFIPGCGTRNIDKASTRGARFLSRHPHTVRSDVHLVYLITANT
jgi:hypothetical protein